MYTSDRYPLNTFLGVKGSLMEWGSLKPLLLAGSEIMGPLRQLGLQEESEAFYRCLDVVREGPDDKGEKF